MLWLMDAVGVQLAERTQESRIAGSFPKTTTRKLPEIVLVDEHRWNGKLLNQLMFTPYQNSCLSLPQTHPGEGSFKIQSITRLRNT